MDPPADALLLFVYGTLMRGDDNHARLGGARFVGEAATTGAFELVDCGPYPAITRRAPRDVESSPGVVGELYELDPRHLPELDAYEGHPELFVRTAIELSDGRVAMAYVMSPDRAAGFPRVASGRWRSLREREVPDPTDN